MKIKIKIWATSLTLIFTAGCAALVAAEYNPAKPNVVIILADDMGFGDVSSNNPLARTKTPNIDALSKSGIRFTEAHAGGATCIPSRYALLTGRYYFRASTYRDNGAKLGGVGYLPPLIEPGRETIGSLMQKAGYATACIGKWHLGMNWELKDPAKPAGLLNGDPESAVRYTNTDFSRGTHDGPNTRGFDYSFILPSSASDPPYVYVKNGQVLDPDVVLIPDLYPTRQPDTVYDWDRKYVASPGDAYWQRGVIFKNGEISRSFRIENNPRILLDEAVSFIRRQAAAPDRRPFLLYFPLSGPHTPWMPNEPFRGRSGMGVYGDWVGQTDYLIGQVHEALVQAGIADNTLLIVTSDNGAHWGEEDVQRTAHQANAGRRGQKADIWDGGHHVPLIVNWPARIREPGTYDQAVSLADLMATFAEMTNQPLNDHCAEDSVSFYRVLQGDRTAPTRETILYESSGGPAIVKDGWKYTAVLGSGGFTSPSVVKGVPDGARGQLYHVAVDPYERVNLDLAEPARAAELGGLLQRQVAQGFSAPRLDGAKR